MWFARDRVLIRVAAEVTRLPPQYGCSFTVRSSSSTREFLDASKAERLKRPAFANGLNPSHAKELRNPNSTSVVTLSSFRVMGAQREPP